MLYHCQCQNIQVELVPPPWLESRTPSTLSMILKQIEKQVVCLFVSHGSMIFNSWVPQKPLKVMEFLLAMVEEGDKQQKVATKILCHPPSAHHGIKEWLLSKYIRRTSSSCIWYSRCIKSSRKMIIIFTICTLKKDVCFYFAAMMFFQTWWGLGLGNPGVICRSWSRHQCFGIGDICRSRSRSQHQCFGRIPESHLGYFLPSL